MRFQTYLLCLWSAIRLALLVLFTSLCASCHGQKDTIKDTEPMFHAAATGNALVLQSLGNAEDDVAALLLIFKDPAVVQRLQEIQKLHKQAREGVKGTDKEVATLKKTYDTNMDAALKIIDTKDQRIRQLESESNRRIDKLIILGLFAAPIGVGLFFYPPANLIGKGVAIAGGTMVLLSVLTKASYLPLLYFAYGCAAIALSWLVWKLFIEKKGSKELIATGALLLKHIPEAAKPEVLKQIASDGGGVQSKSTEALVDKMCPAAEKHLETLKLAA